MADNWLSSKEIGERVRAIRKGQLGVTTARFAELVGLQASSGSDISKIEGGTLWPDGKPNLRLLAKIAKLGGRDLSYFQADADDAAEERRDKAVIAAWLESRLRELREAATPPASGTKSRAKQAAKTKGPKKGPDTQSKPSAG